LLTKNSKSVSKGVQWGGKGDGSRRNREEEEKT